MWIESPLNWEVLRYYDQCYDRLQGGELMPTKEFMNVRETAKHLGVHENTVRNWQSSGILRGFKLPGSGFRRFSREEVERMRREMLGSYAPATELPEHAHTGVSGTVVDDELL
jgi:excisionase family DNA binding protein